MLKKDGKQEEIIGPEQDPKSLSGINPKRIARIPGQANRESERERKMRIHTQEQKKKKVRWRRQKK